MPPALATDPVPLVTNQAGVLLVQPTRVPLATVAAAFHEGATAEQIAQQYPSVPLTSVYQVIGYYLQHRSELDQYLLRHSAEQDAVRALNESRWPSEGIRERLLARR
jgi:uncharacterized protein (DUF433 family)